MDTDVPTITVYDLVDGSYRATASVRGSDLVAVTHPLVVTVSPSSLVE